MDLQKIRNGEIKDLRNADLLGANLQEANLQEAYLQYADLREANLQEANLQYANLQYADLWEADLQGADLQHANLQHANLPDTDIFLNSPYSICHIRSDFIRIGCEYHSVDEWRQFSDQEIDNMDENALEFWTRKEKIIMFIAENL